MPISDLLKKYPTPNILIIITDQERALSEWPESYRPILESKLGSMIQLKGQGLNFTHAYTAACMCSPSRSAFQTSQYPIVTGCTTTGGAPLPHPDRFDNIASVLGQVKPNPYTCYWIGKWHLLGGKEPGTTSSNLSKWGFHTYSVSGQAVAWDPPDGGITLNASYLGGGTKGATQTNQNDQRSVADAISFLQNPPDGPWCLVVSLVNPHDVHLGWLEQDGDFYDQASYTENPKFPNVPLPLDASQDPTTMPRGQVYASWINETTENNTHPSQQNYVNFYAYLMGYVDSQISTIIGAMQSAESTLVIRFADHGEMGLAHGLVEKSVNAYGQCTHVPLVFSNPLAWPNGGETTHAMASTVDLLPTLAGLFGLAEQYNGKFVGADLTPVLNDANASVQDYVHFTYDDFAGSNGPSVIRSVRSRDWVYSVYLDSVTDPDTGYADADWEMYDLTADPQETRNLAGLGYAMQVTLDAELQTQMKNKGTLPAWYANVWPPSQTACTRGGPPPVNTTSIDPPVSTLPGITAANAKGLVYVGVHTVADLQRRCGSPEGRQLVAAVLDVGEAQLDRWIAASSQRAAP